MLTHVTLQWNLVVLFHTVHLSVSFVRIIHAITSPVRCVNYTMVMKSGEERMLVYVLLQATVVTEC